MAAQPSTNAVKNPSDGRTRCVFFARGSCRNGDECQFSHDKGPLPPCSFYAAGSCRIGNECVFSHSADFNDVNFSTLKAYACARNALSVTMASRAALRVFVRGPPAGEPAAAHYRYNSDGTLFHYLPLSSSSAMIVYFTDNQKCDALWQESDASPDLFLERLRADVLLAGDPNISAPEGITTVRRENGAGYMMLRPAEGRQAVLQHAACSPGLPGSDPYALGFYSAIAFANVVHDACEVGQDLGSALVLDRYACRAREYAVQLMAVPHGADLAYGAGNGASSVFGGAINALRPAKEAIAVVLSGDYVESLRAAVTIH